MKTFNFEFPEALKKPVDVSYSNLKGCVVKKRRKSILMPRLLRFTFCFLLFVAQLAPSLPFSFAAPSRLGTARFRAPILPTSRSFFFLLLSFCLSLSRCIKIEFPELKAAPSRLNIMRLGASLEPLGNQSE